MRTKKFLVEISGSYYTDAVCGTMLTDFGNSETTSEDVRRWITRGLAEKDGFFVDHLSEEINVTPFALGRRGTAAG